MQAGAHVVAMQIGDFKVHQPKRVRAVADDLNAVRVGHI